MREDCKHFNLVSLMSFCLHKMQMSFNTPYGQRLSGEQRPAALTHLLARRRSVSGHFSADCHSSSRRHLSGIHSLHTWWKVFSEAVSVDSLDIFALWVPTSDTNHHSFFNNVSLFSVFSDGTEFLCWPLFIFLSMLAFCRCNPAQAVSMAAATTPSLVPSKALISFVDEVLQGDFMAVWQNKTN